MVQNVAVKEKVRNRSKTDDVDLSNMPPWGGYEEDELKLQPEETFLKEGN